MTTSHSPLSEATDEQLASMLFQGEEIEDEYTVEEVRVAVTTHRVLVFAPDGDGRRFDHADRPNVLDARVETTGKGSYVEWAMRGSVYGVVLLGSGLLVQHSGILGQLEGVSPPSDAPGAGIAQMISVLPSLLGTLATVLLAVGAVLLLVGLALVGLYLESRERELVIERAGRDPMRVTVESDDAERVARRLRTTVGTGSNRRTD